MMDLKVYQRNLLKANQELCTSKINLEVLKGMLELEGFIFRRLEKHYTIKGEKFKSLKGMGFKSNYYDVDTGDEFWISGPRKDKNDRLYGGNKGVTIDDDVLVEYKELIK